MSQKQKRRPIKNNYLSLYIPTSFIFFPEDSSARNKQPQRKKRK